jgi:hypothetical protein
MAIRTQDAYGTTSRNGATSAGKNYNGNLYTSSSSTAWQRANTPNTQLALNNAANNFNSGGNSYSGGGSGSSGGGAVNASVQPAYDPQAAALAAMQAMIEAQQRARQQAIDAANAALDKSAGLARDQYNSSLDKIGVDYQTLRDAAALRNKKNQRAMREAQANRGAFGSGSAMQENLTLGSNYSNNMNKIGTQEQDARNTLLNNLNSYLNQIEMQKANNMASGLDNYTSMISSMIPYMFQNYQPSDAYNSLLGNLTAGNGQLSNVVQSNNAVGTGDMYDMYRRMMGLI